MIITSKLFEYTNCSVKPLDAFVNENFMLTISKPVNVTALNSLKRQQRRVLIFKKKMQRLSEKTSIIYCVAIEINGTENIFQKTS